MKNNLLASLRTAFLGLAGLGGYLANRGLIGSADVQQVNDSGATLGDALAVVLSALVAQLALWLVGKIKTGGSVSMFALWAWLCIGMLAAGGLSACQGVPLRLGIQGPDGSVSYSPGEGVAIDYTVRAESAK